MCAFRLVLVVARGVRACAHARCKSCCVRPGVSVQAFSVVLRQLPCCVSIAMVRSSFVACFVWVAAAAQDQHRGGDLAAELGKVIAEIAGKVALEDGYGDEFAAAFSHGQRAGSTHGSAPDGAVAFADVRGVEAGHTLTLRPPQETTEDVARSISALAATDASTRDAAKTSYAEAWQRMLDAEARAVQRIVKTELASLVVSPAAFVSAGTQAPVGAPDLKAVAEHVVAVADAYEEAAKQAPTLAQVAGDMAQADAEMLASLQGSVGFEERQQQVAELTAGGRCPLCARDYARACPESWASAGDGVCEASPSYSGACPAYGFFGALSRAEKMDFEQRCAACWPCSNAGVGFLQVSRSAVPDAVASVRLVEPSSRVSKEAVALRQGVADALVALEARQRSDEASYAGLLASSEALGREVAAVVA